VDLLLTFFEGEIVNSKTIDEADVIIFVVDRRGRYHANG
jgi:predicted GTPase